MNWVGLDIGGANLKMARSDGSAIEVPFPMWKNHEALTTELERLLEDVPDDVGIAVTMTGELADCFDSKEHGVQQIVDSVVQAAGDRTVTFYQTDGDWCDSEVAKEQPLMVASANWHALATLASSFLTSGSGFVIDIGSTTTDVIPVLTSFPGGAGQHPVTDFNRLIASQLVYTGVWRSPLNALVRQIRIDGKPVPLANELFATIADAYIWKGILNEDANSRQTADARPATRPCAGTRLARMVCSDVNEVSKQVVDAIAEAAIFENENLITNAIQQVVSRHHDLPLEFVVSGAGAWLADEILTKTFEDQPVTVHRLHELLDESACRSAAAFAVMKLAENRMRVAERQPK